MYTILLIVLVAIVGSSTGNEISRWSGLYDSVFRASLTEPYEMAETKRSADEMLEELRSHLNDTEIRANERQEVEFWLDLKRIRRFDDDLIRCRAGFERYLLERRWYLVSDPARLKFYLAKEMPQDLKLDEYIEEQRRANFQHCTELHSKELTREFDSLILDNLSLDFIRFERFISLVDPKGGCKKCESRDLAQAICKALEPKCRSSRLLDLLYDLGLMRRNFDEVYERHLIKPCSQLKSSIRSMGTEVDNFLELAREFWFEASSAIVRKWVQYRYLCENYIEDKSFATRIFHLLPDVRRERKGIDTVIHID